MNTLKRFPVKYIRDYIKKDYKLRDACYICTSTVKLELHHLYSVSQLFEKWCTVNNIKHIEDVDVIKELRVRFAEDCKSDLGHDNLFTLCDKHHKHLHNLYGQKYSNHLVPKIKNWLETQKAKNGS
jgi:queuine/archaeosine tRNA-ribosyltransferase